MTTNPTTAALVAAAKATIENLELDDTVREISDGALLIDLREIDEIEETGSIAGAIHVPRGLLEFVADPSSPSHRAELDPGRRTILYCASGGRSALAVNALRQLGYVSVAHLGGGMRAWLEAGRPTEAPAMTLDRGAVLEGIPQEMDRFARLVEGLTKSELATPTRCLGWTVGHVAGHVIGSVVDVAQGMLEGQGTPEVTDRQAQERAGRAGVELAAELRAALPAVLGLVESLPADAWDGPFFADPSYTVGFAVEALWFDAFLHGEDIRAALDLPAERSAGLLCAVHHVAGYLEHRQWGTATLALDGMPEVHVAGGGEVVTGDPLEFVLVATGRAEPARLGLDPSINVYAD